MTGAFVLLPVLLAALPPFADVVKDAQALPGLFTVYRTAEKTYLEVKPDQLDKPFVLATTLESGTGEYSGDLAFYPDMLDRGALVSFRRVGANLQLLERNTRATAPQDAPVRHAVERSFSDSLIGLLPVLSQPHPQRGSVLVDLGAVFVADIPDLGSQLESAYRLPYKLDSATSGLGRVVSHGAGLEIETLANFELDALPVPPPPTPGASPAPTPAPPRAIADLRSILLRLRYSLAEPPPPGYRPRLADDRIGHFRVNLQDYSSDAPYSAMKSYLTRWRLEKANPAAALSRPTKPIVFWIANNVPTEYRSAVREGILLWNRAFERIGFQEALEVREQPDDAAWDAGDVRYNVVRWAAATYDPAYWAKGPSRADPRTGEIFDADIVVLEAATRLSRTLFREEVEPLQSRSGACAVQTSRRAELAFQALAQGGRPGGPDLTRFLHDNLRSLVSHEVGHSLGLAHNFRGSTARTQAQIQDAAFTLREGLTGSVMDYNATNLALKGEAQGELVESTLGPYDYWAIEYAYRPIEAATPEAELPVLRAIAARAGEPQLAYGGHEEAGFDEPSAVDPEVTAFDLGSDPLAFARRRLELSREIWDSLETRAVTPGEGYQELRRGFDTAFYEAALSLRMTAKYVGGLTLRRTHAGDPAEPASLVPVPAPRQREALALLRSHLFGPGAFAVAPSLLARLDTDHVLELWDTGPPPRQDYSFQERMAYLQRKVLNRLFDAATLSRLAASEIRGGGLSLAELFGELDAAIWGEIAQSDSQRRALQRGHLRRLTTLLLAETGAPEDARSLARLSLTGIRRRLERERVRKGLANDVRAHLDETAARIEESLRAVALRIAF